MNIALARRSRRWRQTRDARSRKQSFRRNHGCEDEDCYATLILEWHVFKTSSLWLQSVRPANNQTGAVNLQVIPRRNGTCVTVTALTSSSQPADLSVYYSYVVIFTL